MIDSFVLALAQYPVRFQANLSAAVIENAPTLQAALRQMVELGDIEDRVQQQMQAGQMSAREKVRKEDLIGKSKGAVWRLAFGMWAVQCAFRARMRGLKETQEWEVRASGLYKVLGVRWKKASVEIAKSESLKELHNLYHIDPEPFTERELLLDQYTCRMLLDRSFLRFLPRLATLLSLYATKHLLPSLSPAMSAL